MNDPILPDNDIDVQLAKRLGVLLEEKSPNWSSGDDPFVDMLSQLKSSYQTERITNLPDTEASAKMWQAIHDATKPAQSARSLSAQPAAKIFLLNPMAYRIALAACMLVAVGVMVVLFFRNPVPTLLAEADQAITTYTMADGSVVTLRPHSKLFSLTSDNADSRVQLEGEGYFDVAHDESRTFSVVAGNAQVSVLGTEFNVTNREQAVTVYLQEGSIELKNLQSGQAVILSPGQSGTVDNEQVTLHGQQVDSEEHLDWMDNQIVYTEAPLDIVVEEIEFHFGITLEIPQNRANETISGSIELVDRMYVLNSLSFVMQGGSFVQTGEHSYRFEAN